MPAPRCVAPELSWTPSFAPIPTPVAGCDAQYNHLLAERRRVRFALGALEADVRIPTPREP